MCRGSRPRVGPSSSRLSAAPSRVQIHSVIRWRGRRPAVVRDGYAREAPVYFVADRKTGAIVHARVSLERLAAQLKLLEAWERFDPEKD
jgi:hypothetical protein